MKKRVRPPRPVDAESTEGYLLATRHPWPCALFVLPLLAVYEFGVAWLGGDQSDQIRNGADAWLRWWTGQFGVGWSFAVPLTLAAGLLLWAWWRRDDSPAPVGGVVLGIALESAAFAVGLWLMSCSLGPVLGQAGLLPASAGRPGAWLMVTYIGAGIYEEAVFRLVLFSGMAWLLKLSLAEDTAAILLALVGSSLLFAAAHHVGPHGEAVRPFLFLLRAAIGLYCALLYYYRGFAVAVGAHAGYDVLTIG